MAVIFRLLVMSIIMFFIISINPSLAHESYKPYLNDTQHFLYSADENVPEIFLCTAYDLSYQSCYKTPSDPAYGITANGFSLRGHSRESAMAIAVDPQIIPMGSKVLIVFEGRNRKYSGIYTAVDTGGAIKGNRIDIFFGDFQETVSEEALIFGRDHAKIYRLP